MSSAKSNGAGKEGRRVTSAKEFDRQVGLSGFAFGEADGARDEVYAGYIPAGPGQRKGVRAAAAAQVEGAPWRMLGDEVQ